MEKNSIILGIDPGTTVMGYGLIDIKNKELKLIAAGVLKLEKYDNQPQKLGRIFDKTVSLIEEYKVGELAIEAPFFGKNVQSMLKLGRAQGVAIAAALSCSVPFTEYSPKKIKLAVTGNGNASKEQVAAMLKQLLGFSNIPRYLDATDGLAAAVCHYFQGSNSTSLTKKSFSGWKAFLALNPERQS